MRKSVPFAATLLATMLATVFASTLVSAASATSKADKAGVKPQDSPGWVVLEEDWFVPFRFDSLESLHDARVHYRQGEEKAAANELRKAESWLKFSAGHAEPVTKKSLQDAAAELHTLAADLEKGKLLSARDLDQPVARANQALAEWHYYKAKDNLGKDEEKWAAEDLQTAARHLQAAAESAKYEYGSDLVTVFDDIDSFGNVLGEDVIVDRNDVAANLEKIGHELKKMGETLKNSAAAN